MEMTTIAPSPALAGWVRSFTIVETDEETTRALVPGTGVILGFRYRGSAALMEGDSAVVLPDATLAGMRNTIRRMRTSAGGGIVLANFHEGGTGAFFRKPMHPLFNSIAGLGEWVSGEEIEEVRTAIAAARDSAARVSLIERFLLMRKTISRQDGMVAAAVRAMRAAGGRISIRPLAVGLGLSQDRFEKRFRQAVGASPKQYCSILRVRRAVQSYRPGANLASLSLEAGYYDQSHFIREFRSVTGETPQRFFRMQEYC